MIGSGVPQAAAKPGFDRRQLAASVLLLATFGTFRRREIWELFTSDGFDFEVKAKLVIWALFGLFVIFVHRRVAAQSALLVRLPLLPYVLYGLLAFVSAIYSVSPQITVYRAMQLAILIALGVAYAERMWDWPKLGLLFVGLNWVFLLIGLTGAVPALDWHLLPGFQEAGFNSFTQPWRFGTPMGHFSQISIVASMVAIATAARMRRGRVAHDLVLIAWMVATVLLTVSRTAMMGLVGGLFLVAALRGRIVPCLLGTAFLLSFALAVPGVGNKVIGFIDRGQSEADLESLTNRTSIYSSVTENISKRWLLGYGYRADRFIVLDEQVNGSGVSHAHNAVLEATAGLGAGGAALSVAVLLSLLGFPLSIGLRERRRLRLGQIGRTAEFAGLFPPIFAFSMLDSSFSLDANPFIFVFVAVLIDMAAYGARFRRKRRVAPLLRHSVSLAGESP